MNIEEILDVLDEVLDRAWNLPLTGGRCVVDADKVRDMIDEVRLNLAGEIKQAKAIVDKGAQDYLVDYQRELEVTENDEYIQRLADEGMEVTYLTDEEKATFVDAVAPMYDTAAEDFGQDVMDAVAQYR